MILSRGTAAAPLLSVMEDDACRLTVRPGRGHQQQERVEGGALFLLLGWLGVIMPLEIRIHHADDDGRMLPTTPPRQRQQQEAWTQSCSFVASPNKLRAFAK